jgi:ubiquinone/menaquinone biosynthesis C-methylase UbiE
MTSVSYRDFTGTGAENYERYFVPSIATPVSADLLATADLRVGERVLDVACGTGAIARVAAERVGPTGTVTALDLAPDMIDVARATPAPAGPAIEWHVGDAASLPFEDDAYDAVVCQMGLMFMPDRAAAVAEMRRVAVPGGRVVVNTPGAIQPPFVVLEQAIVEHISADLGGFVRAVFSMHDPEELAGLLRAAGLRDVAAGVSTVRLLLPSPAEFLWQYINLTPMGPIVAQASEEARTAMEREAVDAWQPYVVDGTVRVEQPIVVASGSK